jgi:hypothetical protein
MRYVAGESLRVADESALKNSSELCEKWNLGVGGAGHFSTEVFPPSVSKYAFAWLESLGIRGLFATHTAWHG